MKLTPKQKKFCQEYMIDSNGTQAAIRAGYSKKTAREQACRQLTKVHVLQRMKELQDQAKKRNDIDIDWCLKKLKAIVEDDSNDRVAAVDKIIKHLGGYEKNNDQKSTKINLSRYTDEEIKQKLTEIANDPNKY